MRTLCQTPAKIILSGEHAVLFGAPALSMAIDLPTSCEVNYSELPAGEVAFVEIELTDFQTKVAYPFPVWQKRVINIESRYTLYEKNASSIQTVLQHPTDLLLVALQQFHNHYGLRHGHWQIRIQSHQLSGKGLGSSASVVVALLHSLMVQHQFPVNETDLLHIAQLVESRQHGSSSGIDTTTVFRGGLLRYQQGEPLQQLVNQSFQAWLIDTGKPSSTTGQAVSHVHQAFSPRHPIWKKFHQVTHAIQLAWHLPDSEQLKQAIKDNQLLLEEIGVVPSSVQSFLERINQDPNKAAKVCGAGSISGEHAGMVMCLSQEPPEALCAEFGYQIYPIHFSAKGSQCDVVE